MREEWRIVLVDIETTMSVKKVLVILCTAWNKSNFTLVSDPNTASS